MPKGRNGRLRNQYGIALRAILPLGKSCHRAGGGDRLMARHRMSLGGNDILRNKNHRAHRAMAPLGQTALGAGGGDCRIDQRGMYRPRHGLFGTGELLLAALAINDLVIRPLGLAGSLDKIFGHRRTRRAGMGRHRGRRRHDRLRVLPIKLGGYIATLTVDIHLLQLNFLERLVLIIEELELGAACEENAVILQQLTHLVIDVDIQVIELIAVGIDLALEPLAWDRQREDGEILLDHRAPLYKRADLGLCHGFLAGLPFGIGVVEDAVQIDVIHARLLAVLVEQLNAKIGADAIHRDPFGQIPQRAIDLDGKGTALGNIGGEVCLCGGIELVNALSLILRFAEHILYCITGC